MQIPTMALLLIAECKYILGAISNKYIKLNFRKIVTTRNYNIFTHCYEKCVVFEKLSVYNFIFCLNIYYFARYICI